MATTLGKIHSRWCCMVANWGLARAVLLASLAIAGVFGGSACSNADESPGGFFIDERELAADLSGLPSGPFVVEFNIYAYGGAEFAQLEQDPEKFFSVGKVGVGKLPAPTVQLDAVPGFPRARRLRATIEAKSPGSYLVVVQNLNRVSLPFMDFKASNVKDGAGWQDPSASDSVFPLIRTVGSCRHATLVTPTMSPAKNPGWLVEWSEPFPSGTDFPAMAGSKATNGLEVAWSVKPVHDKANNRKVFIPAPDGVLEYSGTKLDWKVGGVLGAASFENAVCLPGDVAVPLWSASARPIRVVALGKIFTETFLSQQVDQKNATKDAE